MWCSLDCQGEHVPVTGTAGVPPARGLAEPSENKLR